MATLNEYLGFFDKVDKRIRNEKLTELAGPRRAGPPCGLCIEVRERSAGETACCTPN